MLYSTRSLDYRFGHRSHMLFAVTGRRVCIITWSGLSEGFQFHPEQIICSVDSFSIVSLGKMIQLQMHFGFNQSLQLDSSASNEQHKNNFFYPVLQCHFYHDPMKKVIFFYPLPVVIQNCLSSKTFRFQWHFLLWLINTYLNCSYIISKHKSWRAMNKIDRTERKAGD